MKLLALTTSREDGGAESHLRTTLAAARARGYTITVGLPRAGATTRLWEDLRAGGATVHELPIGWLASSKAGSYAAIAADALAVLALVARVRPNVILLNLPTPEASPGAMLACALTRLPSTAIFHLVRADLRVTSRRRAVYRRIASGTQRWICVSEDNRATLASAFGVRRDRIAVVRNGTDVREASPGSREAIRAELGVATDATLILTAGRLGEQKQHRLILAALPGLVESDARLVFVWAGEGPLRGELEAAVHGTGLEGHVRMLGRRADMPELFAACDLFLMPSRDEGAPLALIEAMQAGLPVIVSDAGALTEIIEDQGNGLVFARGEGGELMRAVQWALANREQMASMAARAREQALRELTAEAMTAGVMAQLLQVAQLPRTRTR
jgi:glycosyltransferase involved in cell wall biosynthesis